MKWSNDSATERAARLWHPIPMSVTTPAAQFGGCRFDPSGRDARVLQPADWPAGDLISSPLSIMAQFKAGHYTQALEMVVSWGGMARTRRHIWKARSPEYMEATLEKCASSILATRNLEFSWVTLTGAAHDQLGWTAVIASKTLHFLCRATGFDQEPPVAIDNAIMRDIVWPKFADALPPILRPQNWDGNDFAAYNRYMTAIRIWASKRLWTTTELEATLFSIVQLGKLPG